MTWSALDCFRLAIVAVADSAPPVAKFPYIPAYLFGNTPDNQDPIIKAGALLYKKALAGTIYICGGGPYIHPANPNGPVAYSGEEEWKYLLGKNGVSQKDIFSISRPDGISHTGTEAERLVLIAKQLDWKNVIIVALPFQLPRAFANTVTQTLRIYPELKVWCKATEPPPWTAIALSSQGNVFGELLEAAIDAEYTRLLAIYGNTLDITSPKKIFDYIRQRNRNAAGN